jgi:replicative DNA helicase
MRKTLPRQTSAEHEIAQLRIPPHSMEAEQSVLGGLLLDNEAWDRIADVLHQSDFYRFEHRIIYETAGTLINATKPADVITVYEHLQSLGKAEECGGLPYLNALAQSVPSAANIRRYAEIVRERAILRKLIAAGDEIVSKAFDTGGAPVLQVLDEAESRILQVGEEGSRQAQIWRDMDQLVLRAIDRISERAERGGDLVTGLRTGFPDLDRMTTGLQPGNLIILAARPSMGKTSLALNIAEHAAIEQGLPVLLFSMEMSSDELTLRMIGSTGRVDQRRMQTGRMNDDEWARFAEATERLSKAPIKIDETGGLNPAELRARARRKARECGGKVGLIVVDYLQLMSGDTQEDRRSENRATELAEVSRGLKALAKELQCPVLALSQLNRGVESRNDKRPTMSDLRESGALEQDADVIMFIYRDEYYNKDSTEPGVAEIIIGKQRNGPVGTVKLAFLAPLARFDSLALGALNADAV